ncbi:STAS domain-containing protein [Rufibacter latericius]|uniref:STAS domain-containing protein n=1 Tax=Rufibacter latericius TaxID=2487040 RepID=A0A3M9M9H8_9BACT|nr:anti-sigma factor antagonist [Rufibacter latericius]RNI21837.1 hypothetical protein EFB08_22080 [Rufibacter latericius]
MQKIITEKIGEKVVILLQEDLDASDLRLTRWLQNAGSASQEFHLWIDCSSLECIKSKGVCHFINQLLLLKNQHVHITLLNLGTHYRQMLELLGVNSFFKEVPDFEEAYHLVQAS